MTCEWAKKTIGDICSVVTDGSHYSPKSVSRGEYMVSVKDFTPYGFNFSNCRQISKDDYDDLLRAGCVPQIDDILIGKDGARFFEDIVIYRQPQRPALLSSIAILRTNKRFVHPEYLYYLLKSANFKKDVRENYGSGSAIPRIILKDFKRMPVLIPSLSTQKIVVSILTALDDRIVNNLKINHQLEQIAQAIFKSWFVDFVPWGGVMPDDWNKGTLSDICHYSDERIGVVSLTNDTYVSTENMLPEKKGFVTATKLPTSVQTTAFRTGDILFSNIRPYFKKILYCDFEGGCSADVLCFRPEKSRLSLFLYETLFSNQFFDYVVSGSKGTKMPRGDKQQIMNYPVTIPNDKILNDFVDIITPIIRYKSHVLLENRNLAETRDTLLSRLLSGELPVSDLPDVS